MASLACSADITSAPDLFGCEQFDSCSDAKTIVVISLIQQLIKSSEHLIYLHVWVLSINNQFYCIYSESVVLCTPGFHGVQLICLETLDYSTKNKPVATQSIN